jgi:two-component system NtrC family sensor kinase
MSMTFHERFSRLYERLMEKMFFLPEGHFATDRYVSLRRTMGVLMFLVTMVPLALMLAINYHQYQNTLRQETVNQLTILENKTKHSFELFLQERLSAVKYIAQAYSTEELRDEDKLQEIFFAMQENFSGFVDIGTIDPDGIQVNYVGPYNLQGKDYSEMASYQEVRIRGSYISDVFMGYRGFPHLIIAVEKRMQAGKNLVLRASIDIETFNDIIASLGLGPGEDAFLLNTRGVLQTPSKFYGQVMEEFPVELPAKSFQPTLMETTDPQGRDIFLSYVHFSKLEFVLVFVKLKSRIFQSWYALKGQMIVIFVIGLLAIAFIIFQLTGMMVRRMKQADEKREAAIQELEHSQKLSSIGQMAAGVAHEINNPLAIINEKTGLMLDLLHGKPDLAKQEKFMEQCQAILRSVERAKGITYRLLGFARRLETRYEILDVNEIIRDVLGFLDKEAKDRNVEIRLDLDPDLGKISSDQGQLEQVFLNLLNNSLEAIKDSGEIVIRTREEADGRTAITLSDNGCGMSKEAIRHIFEPFYTTKKGRGTGLGLSITYGIVKKLGGDITVQSQVGQGTTFTVYLPKKILAEGGEIDV